jgi:hypothetical protein
MGIDLAGTTLESSSGLIAKYSGSQIMKMSPNGMLQRYNAAQPMFRAGGAGTAANTGMTSTAWNAMIFNSTNVNVGSCYNTSNGRFTAPVAGVYLMAACTYVQGAAAGWYFHPMFWVNDSATVRRPSAGGLHRMRGHGNTAGYNADTDAIEIMALLAGDYVNFYNYNNAANTWYPQYSRYEGYLLG